MTAALAGDGVGGSASVPPSPASVSSKGKAKMDAETAEEVRTCGICLTRSREAIPGELDCCAHHFCFVCIMAWARVESRCPFCKARFRTIRRPPVPDLLPSERIVAIPERNQVYLSGGNASSTVGADVYANTICSVCNCCKHDELLMLCDLCDLAAHTYCVGLGTIVPEGDWFCEDCAASKELHSQCQVDNEGFSGQGEFEMTIDVPAAEATASPSAFAIVDVDHGMSSGNRRRVQSSRISTDDPVPSIYDIVGDDYTTNVGSIRLRLNSENSPSQGTRPAGSQCPKSIRGRDNGLALYHSLIRMEIERTRALRDSRNRDKRIRALRESWASLRDGSVGFKTHVPSRRKQAGIETVSAVTQHQPFAVPTVVCSKIGASGQLSSASYSEETSTSLGHGNKTSQKDNRDVRKAWKMLQMAKSTGEKKISNNKPSSLSCSPPFSMGNRSTSHSPIDTILGLKNQNLNKVAQKNNANCGHGHGTKMESVPTTEKSEQLHSLPESSPFSVHERIISFQDRINEEGLNGEVAQTLEPSCGTDRSENVKSDTLHPVKYSLSSGQSTVPSSSRLVPSAGSQSTMMVNPEDSSAVCIATTHEFRCSTTIEVRKRSGRDRDPVKCSLSSGQSTVPSSSRLVPSSGSQPTMMVNPEDSSDVCIATTDEFCSSATIEVRRSSGPERHERKRKFSSKKCQDQTSKRSRSSCKIAKTEISSLAICELKLLKIDKRYGSDIFKEVARTATHTVLAACGYEHSPVRSLSLSRPVCVHSSEAKLLKSSGIANSCAECLRDFVKEAISLVLSCRQMDRTVATS